MKKLSYSTLFWKKISVVCEASNCLALQVLVLWWEHGLQLAILGCMSISWADQDDLPMRKQFQ